MQVSYRKAISCFKELADRKLIWEQRQGRGLPNRIFLAEVELDEKSCYSYDCAPFSPEPRPAEIALLDAEDDTAASADSGETRDGFSETKPDAASNTI